MKKITAVLLLVCMLLSLAACAGKETPDTDKATDTDAPSDSTPASSEPDKSDDDAQFEVTLNVPVAEGISIVGGVAPSSAQSVTVSGDGIESTEIKTAAASRGRFFIGQVKTSADGTAKVICSRADGSEISSADIDIKHKKMSNLMTADEYSPVFGLDSRMHFYSALLAYSLSDVLNDATVKRAESNVQSAVEKTKAANPSAEVIYLVVPSSCEVYPESVPSEFTAATGRSVYDIFAECAQKSGAKVIYPIEEMKEHKNDGEGYQLYSYTDSHWTSYGAWVGTGALFDYISEKFPSAAARTRDEMDFYTVGLYGGDSLFSFGDGKGFENISSAGKDPATKITGITELAPLYRLKMPTSTLNGVYRGGKSLYVNGDGNSSYKKETNASGDGLPTAVILRDSFACPAYDIVNDRFSEVVWQSSHNYSFPEKDVAKYKPDYVIYLVSERNLIKVMLENSNATICSYAK